jgi:hypothetical protein
VVASLIQQVRRPPHIARWNGHGPITAQPSNIPHPSKHHLPESRWPPSGLCPYLKTGDAGLRGVVNLCHA